MNKTTLILLFVFFFSFSSYGQLSVGENGNIEVKAGATLDVAGLEITPISDYNVSAGVTIQKSNTSIVLPNGESMTRSYYMDQMLDNLSATLVYNYEDDDMNAITHNAKMVVVDDSGSSMEYEDTDESDYTVTSEFTDPMNFAIVTAGDATLSIETIDGEMSISIYPNPTSSILNINFDGELKMTVFNMLGQQLLETNNKQIDISGFDRGTYILIVQNLESNNSTNFKIIKE
tara:strand:+ start:4427 stop:5122 length:696 start_codon:yes stop_codon:yes gene_type:complete